MKQGKMKNRPLHEWTLQQNEAIALQRELAKRVVREDRLEEVRHVAGIDMAINEENGMARAAVALLSYPALELEERHVHVGPARMPYIPGLTPFPEVPAILGALDRLSKRHEAH